MKIKLLSVLSLLLILVSCENSSDQASIPNLAPKTQSSEVSEMTTEIQSKSNSKIGSFMQAGKICEILSANEVKTTFNIQSELRAEESNYGTLTCSYSWEPEDIEERRTQFLSNMQNAASGTAGKTSMREKLLDVNFTVALSEYSGTAKTFVPVKLSEEQLQQQIERAKEQAAKRLTDKQKEILGDSGANMMESMLRKNNNNLAVEGIGDAAYWSHVGQGSLHVLSGNINMIISPMIARTMEEDIDNAKSIAQLILK